MNTSSPNEVSTEDVQANVDDARAALETANSALATATAYGRIVIAGTRNTRVEATKDADCGRGQRPSGTARTRGPLLPFAGPSVGRNATQAEGLCLYGSRDAGRQTF